MTTQVLEGIWEDLIANAKSLNGRKVRVTVVDEEIRPRPNTAMLEALRKVKERTKNMPVSSDEDTQKLIREARSGRMFDR